MAKKEEAAEQLTPQQQKLKALQAAMAKILFSDDRRFFSALRGECCSD